MKRYYISNRASNYYKQCESLKQTVKDLGAKNVRSAYQFGWGNQPKVVTFSATEAISEAIQTELNEGFLIREHWAS